MSAWSCETSALRCLAVDDDVRRQDVVCAIYRPDVYVVGRVDVAQRIELAFQLTQIDILGDRLQEEHECLSKVAEDVVKDVDADDGGEGRVKHRQVDEQEHDGNDQDRQPPQDVFDQVPGCNPGVERLAA